MSATTVTEEEARAAKDLCASCGIAEVDNIKLEECDGCDLVKYCSSKCREDHREQHAEDCKKRTDKLHDKELFTQPDSYCHGECPICFLPMPLDLSKSTFYSCCSKTICNGCEYADDMSNKPEHCPFCREPDPFDEEEVETRHMKRIEAGDPSAMSEMGTTLYHEGNYDASVQYWKMAAESGDLAVHSKLGYAYWKGEGVEKDEEKAVYHWEVAAIGGHPSARRNLGYIEGRNGRVDRAVKHFIIAAKLGHTGAMEALWGHYPQGNISKEDLEATLRTHQAAIDAMKSPQREAAAAAGYGG